MSIVSDYKAINAKLNGIDIDKEAFRNTFKTFFEAYNLEIYKAYGHRSITFEVMETLDKTSPDRVFFETLTKYLIDKGYSP